LQLQTARLAGKTARAEISRWGNVFSEFGHNLASCNATDEVGAASRHEIARHGYDTSACRAFVPSSKGTTAHCLFRNWSKDWTRLSDQKKFPASSVIVTEARKRMTPFTWLEAAAARTLTAAEQEVLDTAAEWGWLNGLVVPVHGPNGYFATVSMGSPERDLDLSPRNRLRIQMIAMLAHERSRTLASFASTDSPRDIISARELECLRWVAAGKTDWEIGMILSISAATVKFHLDRARAKLGARTRAQAVARLVLYGLH
jgi:LuxR family transcriptional regulator, quorum-sensing system regulator BjaR1